MNEELKSWEEMTKLETRTKVMIIFHVIMIIFSVVVAIVNKDFTWVLVALLWGDVTIIEYCDAKLMISMNNIENDDFYRGYAARDKVAKEICSKCTYMKKARQQNKTYKGMLQKQNKIIDAMAETIIEDTDKLGTFWCNGCLKLSGCPYEDVKQCVREHFEREVKENERSYWKKSKDF